MADASPLVVRFGAFGDMVILTALIRELHARYGKPVDVLTSGPWSEPLLTGQPGVGRVITVRSRKTPYWLAPDQRRALRALRARGVGPTWMCDANAVDLPMMRRLSIPRDHCVDVKDHPLLPGESATAYWERLALVTPRVFEGAGSGAGFAGTGTHGCALTVGAAQRAETEAWLASQQLSDTPLLLIQMGNKRTMRRGVRRLAANHKHWPQERWAQVLRHLRARHPRAAILLLGTGPESELNESLREAAPAAGAINVAHGLTISRLVALLARGHGLVTVDSGPAHAAAAVGCPQVTLFGKASVTLYRPSGVPDADVRVVTGMLDGEPSMMGISVEQVTRAWDSLALRERV